MCSLASKRDCCETKFNAWLHKGMLSDCDQYLKSRINKSLDPIGNMNSRKEPSENRKYAR